MTDYKLVRYTWTRFLTWTYWRLQLAALWGGKAGLNVIEAFEFELPFDGAVRPEAHDRAQDVPSNLEVPAHSQRVYGELWQNGAFIEVLVYEQPQPGEDVSDRIHLMITDCDGNRRGWLMNVEDATAIVKGLEIGMARARGYGVPERA